MHPNGIHDKAPTRFFENEARACGFQSIAGLDEAGRGPLAGPVVGAAVILPHKCPLSGLDDSKQLVQAERERLYEEIIGQAVAWGIGQGSAAEIDSSNILEATRLAWTRAILALDISPDFLLIDAATLPGIRLPQRSIVKGDQLSLSIAAASVLAKVTRDRAMEQFHRQFPCYNFHAHKGYPTAEHLSLLKKYGPCLIHRRSFRPVMASNEGKEDAE